MERWKNVLFSVESRIALRSLGRRQRVYGRKNERYSPCAMTETVAYLGGTIMIWGGISYKKAGTDLVVFNRGEFECSDLPGRSYLRT